MIKIKFENFKAGEWRVANIGRGTILITAVLAEQWEINHVNRNFQQNLM